MLYFTRHWKALCRPPLSRSPCLLVARSASIRLSASLSLVTHARTSSTTVTRASLLKKTATGGGRQTAAAQRRWRACRGGPDGRTRWQRIAGQGRRPRQAGIQAAEEKVQECPGAVGRVEDKAKGKPAAASNELMKSMPGISTGSARAPRECPGVPNMNKSDRDKHPKPARALIRKEEAALGALCRV